MVWAIPDPPDDSCFILDKDDQGNPRLSWTYDEPRRDAGKAFVGFFLVVRILAGLVVFVCLLVEVITLFGGGGRPATVVFGVLWLVMRSGAAYCLARILHKYLLHPDPETLTLTDSVLKYDPGFSNYYRVLVQRAIIVAMKTEIPRQRIWEVSWFKGGGFWSRHVGMIHVRFGMMNWI
jgi:hypothetical protein